MATNMIFDKAAGKTLRAVSMLNWAAGMNDLKAYWMLRRAMARAAAGNDASRKQAAKAADDYLQGVLKVFNGDHKPTWPNEPYLGTSTDWGGEWFYDQFQERMLRHLAGLSGVKWVD